MPKLPRIFGKICLALTGAAFVLLLHGSMAAAKAPLPPDPQNGSVGVEGTITSVPPTTAATIAVPTNGQIFTNEPVTVSGLCTGSLLVRLFSNGVFIGSAQCSHNSFSITTTLFEGQNQLVARVYDALDQAGPDSNTITVTFASSAATTGPQLLLTSAYAERGAVPGSVLSWPITLTGGTTPFAVSIDWGDSTAPDLLSEATPGTFTAQHTYKQSGVYQVLVKATDKNGTTAYLQLVGVGNGAITPGSSTSSSSSGTTTVTKTKVVWWPSLILLPVMVVAFWLGTRYELVALRRRMERSSEELESLQ